MSKLISVLTILFFSLILIVMFGPAVFAEESSSEPTAHCSLTINPDPIFAGEDFSVSARADDRDHKFKGDLKPYTVKLSYSTPTKQVTLGDMKLIKVNPDEDDKCEFKCKKDSCSATDKGDGCTELDPGDQIDSQNMEGEKTFSFGVIGSVILQVFDKNNEIVCSKNTTVEYKQSINAQITKPVIEGSKLVISGTVKDHLVGVGGVNVNITINSKTVTSTTDDKGNYLYNKDDTTAWGLVPNRTYSVKATAILKGQAIDGSDVFEVQPQSEGGAGVNSSMVFTRIVFNRYFNSSLKKYWSTTTLQNNPPPSTYTLDGILGDVFSQDDQSGNLTKLYDCLSYNDHYNSTNFDQCNKGGQTTEIGFIYKNSAAGTHPIYNCVNDGGEHKLSLYENCKEGEGDTSGYSKENVLGYALSSGEECLGQTETRNQPLVVDTSPLFSLFTKLQLVTLPTSISDSLNQNPKNSFPVCIGVRKDFLVDILGYKFDFGNLLCQFAGITGLGNFCPQTLEIGENKATYFLSNSVDTLHKSSIPVEVPPGPTNPNLYDASSQETGNAILSDLGNQLGTCQGYLSVDSPCFDVKPDEPSYVRDAGESLVTPTGDVYSRMCFFFQTWLPPGIVPNGFPACPPNTPATK